MEQITRLSGVEQFFSSNSDEWGTPERIYQLAEHWWGPHVLDAAANETNHLCEKWSGDSLEIEWAKNNWCNPPFSLADAFVQKAIAEATEYRNVTLLLKAAPETERFKWLLKSGFAGITFLSPRVHYNGAGRSCPFPSCFVRLDRYNYTKSGSFCQWYDFNKGEYY